MFNGLGIEYSKSNDQREYRLIIKQVNIFQCEVAQYQIALDYVQHFAILYQHQQAWTGVTEG